jgi:hypothetical protein
MALAITINIQIKQSFYLDYLYKQFAHLVLADLNLFVIFLF